MPAQKKTYPHPSNFTSFLLPCPVCGKPAELHKTAEGTDEYPDSGCFVVFCQDTHCAGNCSPSRSTADEAIAAWNELAANPNFRWYKSCCPPCGWSDPEDFPQPSKLQRILNSEAISSLSASVLMNFLWFRLCSQSAGFEISLIQNFFYALPFTLLFLLPYFVFRGFFRSLCNLISRQQKKADH